MWPLNRIHSGLLLAEPTRQDNVQKVGRYDAFSGFADEKNMYIAA
jgi:hypothetical protein